MNIQTKALIETSKVLGFGVLFGIAFSFLIDFVYAICCNYTNITSCRMVRIYSI